MNALSTQVSLGIAAVALAGALSLASLPTLATLVSVGLMAVLAFVAFAAQSRHLREEARLVYRPVYVRRHDVGRRITSDDA